MTDEIKALASHRLARSHEALLEGEHLLEKGAPMGAVNRFYYAAFHAARALLATKQLDSARHSGLISLFQQNFVKTGLVDRDKARALSRSFEKRQKSDYGDFAMLTIEEAGTMREEVHASIEECARVLGQLS